MFWKKWPQREITVGVLTDWKFLVHLSRGSAHTCPSLGLWDSSQSLWCVPLLYLSPFKLTFITCNNKAFINNGCEFLYIWLLALLCMARRQSVTKCLPKGRDVDGGTQVTAPGNLHYLWFSLPSFIPGNTVMRRERIWILMIFPLLSSPRSQTSNCLIL